MNDKMIQTSTSDFTKLSNFHVIYRERPRQDKRTVTGCNSFIFISYYPFHLAFPVKSYIYNTSSFHELRNFPVLSFLALHSFQSFIFQKQKAVYSWNVHESQCKLSLIYKKDGLLMFKTNLNNKQIVWLGKKNVNSLSVDLETGRFLVSLKT